MKLERLSKFYNQANKIYDGDSEGAFEAGFIYGLAEKVYIGACPAAMTVSYESDVTRLIVYTICTIFDLFPYEKPVLFKDDMVKRKFTEFWMFKYDMHRQLLDNDQNNNVIRAMLCGYNPEGIEPNFDLRTHSEA